MSPQHSLVRNFSDLLRARKYADYNIECALDPHAAEDLCDSAEEFISASEGLSDEKFADIGRRFAR